MSRWSQIFGRRVWGKKNGDWDGTDRKMASRGDVGRSMGVIGDHFQTWLATEEQSRQSGPFHDFGRRAVLWFRGEPPSALPNVDPRPTLRSPKGASIVRTASYGSGLAFNVE